MLNHEIDQFVPVQFFFSQAELLVNVFLGSQNISETEAGFFEQRLELPARNGRLIIVS